MMNYFQDSALPTSTVSLVDQEKKRDARLPLSLPTSRLLLPDLEIDALELEASFILEDKPLFLLECSRQEGCLSSSSSSSSNNNHYWERRRLLRFTASVKNVGQSDFVSHSRREEWKWHSCHRHFHSMESFASFDLLSSESGTKVAEGHKASFCLEDNVCDEGITPKFRCSQHLQGISVGCSDVYSNNIDCQWIDLTDVSQGGNYTFRVSLD
jgi:lysyl oxidase-like protein 2/3/4